MSGISEGGCTPCRTCGGNQSQGWHLHDEPEARIAAAEARALREAADAWAGGEWRAVNFNRAGRDETPWARQARWLRDRADQIEAEHA